MEDDVSPVDMQQEVSCPKPGTFIPKELHIFLDKSYGEIKECEYKFVALEVEDPVIDDHTGGDTVQDNEIDLDPTNIFVHIVRKVDSDVTIPLLQEYEIDDGTENLHIVKAYQLFKLVPDKKEENIENQLTIDDTGTLEDEMRVSSEQLLLRAIYREIRQCLTQAWKLSEEEKRKIVKRLLIKWQPDNTADNVAKVFQYILQCIQRLHKGIDLTDEDADELSGGDSSESSTSECNWESSWIGQILERHKRERKFHESTDKSTPVDEFDGDWTMRGSFFAEKRPQPYHYHAEARRWQKQAKSDLDNSMMSLNRIPNNSFNWVCYMAHQAAEKSMKAAWYAKDANKIHTVRYSHNLNSIASGLGSLIESQAKSLTSLTGEHTRMRYPDAFYGQRMPKEAFSKQTAETVVSAAKQIIDTVQSNYIR